MRPRDNAPGSSPEQDLGFALVKIGAALGGLVGGFVWATGQLAGLVFGQDWLHVGLVDLVDIVAGLPRHPADPALAWPPAAQAELPGPVGMYASAVVVLVATALALIGIGRWVGWLRHGRVRQRRRRRGARWASLWELRRLLVRQACPGRVTLGRRGRFGPLVAAQDTASVLVVGPPGSGKTADLIIPVVREWAGPVVATSVKPDVIRATADDRAERGRLLVFDPLGLSGYPAVRWSPLATCADWSGAIATAELLARTAEGAARTDQPAAGGGDHAFWLSLAIKLLAPLLHAAAVGGLEMADVVRWIDTREGLEQRGDTDGEPDEVTKILTNLADPRPALAWYASGRHPSRTLDSICATVEQLLGVYADPRVQAMTSTHELDWDAFLTGEHTLYLYAPAHEQRRLRPVFETILGQLLRHAQERAAIQPDGLLWPRLLLALDEAGNVAALAELPELVTTARGQGIQLLTVWHDWAQLKGRYGERAATVFNGHRAKLLLPGIADPELLRQTSELLGERAYTELTRSLGDDGREVLAQGPVSYRPLLTGDELRRLPANTAIAIYGNTRPFRLRLRPYYTVLERWRHQRAQQRRTARDGWTNWLPSLDVFRRRPLPAPSAVTGAAGAGAGFEEVAGDGC